MEQYEVRIFPTAQQDLLDVIDYLNTLSPDTALKYYDRLTSEIAERFNISDQYLQNLPALIDDYLERR